MTAQTADVKLSSPETLVQFLKLLLKGMIKRLPLKLLLAGGIALLAWIIHTYLLVVSNEGFNPGNSIWSNGILALQGNTLGGTLLWTLAAGLVTSTIARILAYGFGNTIRGVAETPKHILQWAGELGILAIPFLFVGYFSAIFVGFFVNNNLLIIQFFLIVLGIIIARHTSVLLTILRLGWSDAQKATKRDKLVPFNIAWPGMYFIGVLVGLLAILPDGGLLAYVCGCLGFLLIVLISVGIFVRSQGGTERIIGKKVLLWVLVPALLTLFLSITSVAFADDGGWAESGGTFGGWVRSPGAVRAVLMGFLPAAGAGLGVLFGTALGGMVSIIGAAGLTTDPFSIQPADGPTSAAGSSPPEASRTAASQAESYQYQQGGPEPPGESSGPLESRTADHQAEQFQQTQIESKPAGTEAGQLDKSAEMPMESKTADHQTNQHQQSSEADPSTMPARHQGENVAQTEDFGAEGESQMRSDRASQEIEVEQSRTADEAVETGTEQRDVRGVDPQSSSATSSESGTAVESADRVTDLEQDTPAAQMSDRYRSDSPDTADGPLANRNQPGGLTDQTGESGQLTSQQQPDSVDGPLGDRNQPGGMTEAGTQAADAKPAGIEQGQLGAERHSPTEASDGPLASRHDPEGVPTEGAGGMRARRFTEEDAGPTAERFTSSEESIADPGPLQSRQPVDDPTGVPLPPVPIPPVTLGWDLVVVRTPAGSGLEPDQRLALGKHTRIGRHGEIDIKISDLKVSRQHADVDIQADNCTITDLNSSNGTFINGKRMSEPQTLKPGDAIKIGDTYFVVEQRGE